MKSRVSDSLLQGRNIKALLIIVQHIHNIVHQYIIHNSYILQVESHNSAVALHAKTIILCKLFLCCRSPVLRRQAMLASSCSQLEAIAVSDAQQQSCIPEFRVHPSTPLHQGALSTSTAPPALSSAAGRAQSGGQGNKPLFQGQPLFLRRRAGKIEKAGQGVRRDSEGPLRLHRSHSEPGLCSSTDTGEGDIRLTICS